MDLKSFYDDYWSLKDDSYDASRLALLLKRVPAGSRLLEVACGPGILGKLLKGKGVSKTLGQWDSRKSTVYIRRSLLHEELFWQLVETYTHELVHMVSGASDSSRSFESAIFKVPMNVMVPAIVTR